MANIDEKAQKQQVISDALTLLEKNKEWEERYRGYISNALAKEKGKRPFNKPEGLSLYSSVSMYKGNTYDLRFDGQSVGQVRCRDGKAYLNPRKDANETYFKFKLSDENEEWEWKKDSKAIEFRKFFRDTARKSSDIKLKSPEHRVENRLLKEFSKSVGKEKSLCNIQPVKLYGCFFQFPTPFKASEHGELTYAAQYGGGIDILARVKTNRGDSRICVMEVKDQNTDGESQSAAMEQALIYATFVARLLRCDSSQLWWDFFRNNNKDTKPIPSHLDIDVVTIMPKGDTDEFCDETIKCSMLSTTFHCHSLYYDDEEFKNERFVFSGTYPQQLKKYKRKA